MAVPDLRNGSLVNIQQAAPKASMSALYYWPIITSLPTDKAVGAVDFIIRTSYAQLLHVTGGAPTANELAEMRKKAIVLGAIRAGAAAAYKLVAQDLTTSELAASGMQYHAGGIGQSAQGTTSAGRWTVAQSMADLVPGDHPVVGTIVYIGMAVPVLQGVSLVMTGHHYIPTTYNLFAGIKRQALGSAPAEVRTWIEAMGTEFDDMAFHKACHPIAPILKRELAKKMDTAHRLRASGHGAAAIRLPAVPSEASGGKAAIALVKSASATIGEMGHTIDCSGGIALMVALENAGGAVAEAKACDDVVQWIDAHSSTLAFCAGIVQQVHEASGAGRNTILAAYSIKRLMSDNPARVSQGIAYARAAAARLRAALESGTYADPAITI
jgi:hypothetical protein